MNEDDARAQKPAPSMTPIGDLLSGFFPSGMTALPEAAEVEEEPSTKLKTASRKAPQPSAKLAKAAAEIKGRPTYAERNYMAREMVQCTLPLRDPGKVTVWARKNGNFTLILQSGIDPETMQPRGLPYGEWARLLLIWIITEAKRTGSRHIKLGRSFTSFVRLLGGDPDKGGNDAKRLKEQLLRLLDCHIDFKHTGSHPQEDERANVPMRVAPKHRLWWSSKTPNQDTLFESELILGEEFFASIMDNPVPVDLRVVAALKSELKQSSFAIDVYIWATWRIFKMREKGIKEIIIPLDSLEEQFGAEFGRTLDFKRQLTRKLNEVRLFSPAIDRKFTKTNFHLIDAGDLALLPAQKAAKKRLAQFQPHGEISYRTRSRFVRAYPEHHIETALSAFHEWRLGQSIDVGNIDALFWSFAKTWTKNNPA